MSKTSTQIEPQLPTCGGFPYVPAKAADLAARGLLRPDAWRAVNVVARARGAAVERRRTETGAPAIQVSFRGVVVVIVRERVTLTLSVLTAYAPSWGRLERIDHVFQDAARGVTEFVDLQDRWRGLA